MSRRKNTFSEPNLFYTVAHIGHRCIFFTVYICNSDFHCRNPGCSNSKFATRIFTAKIRVVCISKFGSRIFTAKIRVVCNTGTPPNSSITPRNTLRTTRNTMRPPPPPWRASTSPSPRSSSITKIRQKNLKTQNYDQWINRYLLSVTGKGRLGQINWFTHLNDFWRFYESSSPTLHSKTNSCRFNFMREFWENYRLNVQF